MCLACILFWWCFDLVLFGHLLHVMTTWKRTFNCFIQFAINGHGTRKLWRKKTFLLHESFNFVLPPRPTFQNPQTNFELTKVYKQVQGLVHQMMSNMYFMNFQRTVNGSCKEKKTTAQINMSTINHLIITGHLWASQRWAWARRGWNLRCWWWRFPWCGSILAPPAHRKIPTMSDNSGAQNDDFLFERGFQTSFTCSQSLTWRMKAAAAMTPTPSSMQSSVTGTNFSLGEGVMQPLHCK